MTRVPKPLTDNGSSSSSSKSPEVPVCWEVISADIAAGRCEVYSIRVLPPGWSYTQLHQQQQLMPGPVQQQPPLLRGMTEEALRLRQWQREEDRHRPQQHQQLRQLQQQTVADLASWEEHEATGVVPEETLLQWFSAELELATAGCHVHLITSLRVDLSVAKADSSKDSTSTQQQQLGSGPGSYLVKGHPNITAHHYTVGPLHDPFADPPVHTLDSLRQQLGHGGVEHHR